MLARGQQQAMPEIGAVCTRSGTDAHQKLLDTMKPITVGECRADGLTWPQRFRVPCRNCGTVFWSRVRVGQVAKTCGRCRRYEPRVIAHPRGGVTQMKAGPYSHRQAGQSLGVTEYGTPVVCAHPDCLALFLAVRPNHEYCAEHAQLHPQTLVRLRRDAPPKLERHRFFLAAGVNGVQYQHGPLSETVDVPPQGRIARDEQELHVLVQLLRSGALIVERVDRGLT